MDQINGFENMPETDAKKAYDKYMNSGLLTDDAKNKISADYDKKYVNEKGVVNVFASDFKASEFGTFVGTNKDGSSGKQSEQSKYIDAIIEMARNGEFKEGDLIVPNFGSGTKWAYKYLGNGKFEKYKKVSDLSTGHNYFTGEQNDINEYELLKFPSGYKMSNREVMKTN